MVTSGFTGAILDRLDTVYDLAIAAGSVVPAKTDGLMGLGYGGKSRMPQAGPSGPLTAYAIGTFAGGNRSDSPNLAGFNYDANSATVGIEYTIHRLIIGLAGSTTTTTADLNTGAGIDADAIQAAVYLSYATRYWFADALAAVGHHELDLARPAVSDTVRSSTNANAHALAAKAGYLFDFGSLRAGPIAGLAYIHSRLDGYTEKGDPELTFTVSGQTLDALTGNVGIRFLAPFQAGGTLFVPVLNVTIEHQFGDSASTLTAGLSQAPAVLLTVPSFDTRTYGRVEGGLTVQFDPNFSATLNAASTIARDEGNDYRISAGLYYRF